jgi:hypothetical protein
MSGVHNYRNLQINISYYTGLNTDDTMSQVETNKAIINRYFEAYKTKNEAIFDEIIAPDYIDHGQVAYMGSPHINFRGVSIYRIQNGKMVETWHVTDSLPSST